MTKKEALSWLNQPGIKAMMPTDKHTQEALVVAMKSLEDKVQEEHIYRKILITDGMSRDVVLFLTDAPACEIEDWCRNCVKALEDGISYTPEALKTLWYVKILFDSEVDDTSDDILGSIGYDESYDLGTYSRNMEDTE